MVVLGRAGPEIKPSQWGSKYGRARSPAAFGPAGAIADYEAVTAARRGRVPRTMILSPPRGVVACSASGKKTVEDRQAVEEVHAMAVRLPDPDGVVSVEQFHEFVQVIVDHDVSLTRIPAEWTAVRLGTQRGVFIKQDTKLLLKNDESALYEAPVGLLKEVTDREYRGGSHGVSVPLGGGVRYRVGAMRGQVVTIGKHWETADSGVLTVTDQRIAYRGGRKDTSVPVLKARLSQRLQRCDRSWCHEPTGNIIVPNERSGADGGNDPCCTQPAGQRCHAASGEL